MTQLWSPPGPAQTQYEHLRELALLGQEPRAELLESFRELGLAGLLLGSSSQTSWSSTIRGASRPRWSPYQDPREQILADAFSLLLAADSTTRRSR